MRGSVSAAHLERRAYVYVRQSSARQVFEHGESTARQYALADRARALGWSDGAVEVIDEDLGRSGSTAEGRDGFQRLAEAVAHGEVGAILAIEVSRLARSSQDWQRLLSLCAVAGVVVIDESTVYDPADRDDKLLLDLKGTMSEAELTWLGLRLRGACRSKARRGELSIPAPTGYVKGEHGLELDPDEAVQRAVRSAFERYAIEPSAWAVVRWARETGLEFPTRRSWSDGSSEVIWKPLTTSRLCNLLHNPVYAGVYAYGRSAVGKALVDGEIRTVCENRKDPESWFVRIEEAHPGYITWETFQMNQEKLRGNSWRGRGSGPGPSRDGGALLSGMLVCGRCGLRMRPTYSRRASGRWFTYTCVGERSSGGSACWSLPGGPVDEAVQDLFLGTVVPDELELCLAVEREADAQSEGLAEQWRLRIEQARYESRRAERRYKAVDPDNRVVARTLEREWEQRLCELEEVQRRYEDARSHRLVELTEEDRGRIRALARDLPAVWRSPTTGMSERKAMLRMVIEAVSLTPVEVPQRATRVRVQWRSGAVSEVVVPRPRRGESVRTPREAVERIRELARDGKRDEEIADELNSEGLETGMGKEWDIVAVKWARRRNGVELTAPDLPRRLPLPDRRPDGRWSVPGASRRFGVSVQVIRRWIEQGLVESIKEPYSRHGKVWWITLDEEMAERLKEDGGIKPPHKGRLPDRHPDGRYSLVGVTRRFGVTKNDVRGWIRRGLVSGKREDYGMHRRVWWLDIDEETAERLERTASRIVRRSRKPPSKEKK
jgi:DNA invertase Pin-like site-specific DNA recombinase